MTRFGVIASSLIAVAAFAADAGTGPTPTVAVLYFDYDKTDELEVLKKGLAQMLITDLGANPSVVLVERARIQAILDEQKLTETKKVDPATAVKLGKLLSAQYVLLGGYFTLVGQLQINTRLLKVQTGELIPGPGVRGKPEAFFDLEAELTQKLSTLLSTQVPSDAVREAGATPKRAHAAMTVAVQYSKALDAIDKKDRAGAKKMLEAVVKENPDFVLASIDLAQLVK
jgi:TolB-like protein